MGLVSGISIPSFVHHGGVPSGPADGSASHVIRKRVRKYYKKKEERTRHEVRGHWHYEAEPNLLKLVYPLEASVKGSLGGPLVKEWAVLKDGEGQAIGLKYDGNDKYHMAAVDAARPWD
eukprot:GGOE01054404.1.p2 GENE.GGOE01054404.1~~GGOE01054404.1.p2  ORF type:complete len:119 (+),score=23.00 GGOE01054404.1:384-740(+)